MIRRILDNKSRKVFLFWKPCRRNSAMKLSCLPVSFFQDLLSGRMTILEWANLGEEEGLDAIDLRAPCSSRSIPRHTLSS
jgi:hypothetical protein